MQIVRDVLSGRLRRFEGARGGVVLVAVSAVAMGCTGGDVPENVPTSRPESTVVQDVRFEARSVNATGSDAAVCDAVVKAYAGTGTSSATVVDAELPAAPLDGVRWIFCVSDAAARVGVVSARSSDEGVWLTTRVVSQPYHAGDELRVTVVDELRAWVTVDLSVAVAHDHVWTVDGGSSWKQDPNGRDRSSIEDLLLVPSNLGDDFVADLVPTAEPVGCSTGMAGSPSASAVSSSTSNARQQRIRHEVRRFATTADAQRAFEAARSRSVCPQPGNRSPDGGAPTTVDISGANEAYAIDFANDVGAESIVVFRIDSLVEVVSVDLHNGDTDQGIIGSLEAAERAALKTE